MSSLKPEVQQEFVASFKDIETEKELRDFETENQLKILGLSPAIQGLWEEKWEKLTGSKYWVRTPITSKVGDKALTDPRSNQYLAEEEFSALQWRKSEIKLKNGNRVQFTIHGTVRSSQIKRHLWNNLSTYALPQRLGEEAANQILKDAKGSKTSGELVTNVKLRVMGFWLVSFHPRQGLNDTEKVKLHWEGLNIQITRGASVPIPGFLIEAAHNTLEAQYTSDEKESRKLVCWVERNPCDIQRVASYEEWVKFKAEGDRIYSEDRKRAGYQQ